MFYHHFLVMAFNLAYGSGFDELTQKPEHFVFSPFLLTDENLAVLSQKVSICLVFDLSPAILSNLSLSILKFLYRNN